MKRADIQGLRCICIVMVLLYHYYPEYFPQGRLGVDMFFVISGFLIALMLSKKKNGFLDYFLQFYWRRVKRILPLCYLVFFLSFVTMYALRLETFIPMNKAFGKRTLAFLANLKVSDEDQYEQQLTGAKILLMHYWSLSTEVQFYLLAPFIVICVQSVKSVCRKTLYFSFLVTISLLHFNTNTEAIRFNSPIARLWQFLAGFIAFYNCLDSGQKDDYGLEPTEPECKRMLLDVEEQEQDAEKIDKKDLLLEDDDVQNRFSQHLTTISILSLTTVISILFIPAPSIVMDTVFRMLVTVATAWILMADGRNPEFLRNIVFVYVGDISFALYLVHWPILCFVKTYEQNFVTTFAIPIAFVISMLAAVFLHEVFEKRYLQWSTLINILLILILILACSALVFIDFESKVIAKKVGSKDDFFAKAIKANRAKNMYNLPAHFQVKRAESYKLEGFNYPRLQRMAGGTGNLTILIIGNSYAGNQANQIFDGLEKLHKNVFLYWTHTCETLLTTRKKGREGCVSSPMHNAKLLEVLKPDLLFIVERGVSIKDKINTSLILEDPIMQNITTNLEAFQKYTKRIFILGAIRKLVEAPVPVAIKYLNGGKRLRDSPSLVMNDNMYHKIRLSKITEVCAKCVVYEWEHIFYNSTGVFEPYDPKTDVLYFDNMMHLGDDGMKKMEAFYADFGKELQWMREKNLLLL